MNDPRRDEARWDDPRTEILGDADTLAFGSGRDRPLRTLPRWLLPVLTFAVGVGAGSGGVYAALSEPDPPVREPVPTTTTVNHDVFMPAQVRVGPFQSAPDPADPKAGSKTWCGARLAPGRSPAGQFVATVEVSNMGNVTMRYLITGAWEVSSGVEVRRSRTREFSPGTVSHVTIRVPVTRAEVLANRAVSSERRCSTEVQLTGFYDDAFTR
jgi:hypothetical protein